MTSAAAISVVILSWNRPLFLWACLDSLFRYTRHPADFYLVDNGSSDALVRDVIKGFTRRQMFKDVELADVNLPARFAETLRKHRVIAGEYLVYVEGDVVVFDTDPCWLTRMRQLMDEDPDLGVLGSCVDQRDFVSRETARRVAPGLTERRIDDLIKSQSPERGLAPTAERVIDPFNPPGRLRIFRTSVLDRIKLGRDRFVYDQVKGLGFKAGLSTEVRHRHLSLLNLFDYPDYDLGNRRAFMERIGEEEPGKSPASG